MKRNALILAAALGFAALTGCGAPLEETAPNPAPKVAVSSSAGTAQSPEDPEKPSREAEQKPNAAATPTKRGSDKPLQEKESAVPEASSVPVKEPATQPETTKAQQNEPVDADRLSTPTGEPQDAELQSEPLAQTGEPRTVSTAKPIVNPTTESTAVPTSESAPVPTATPSAAPILEPTAVPTPEPTPEPIPETIPEPVPSGPYDYPFDVSAICSDLIGVGQSMGLTHVTSMDGENLTPNNTSWSMPVTASQSFQGAALETSLKDYVRSMPGLIASYGGTPLQYFSIYVESLGSESYNFYFLY